MKNKIRLTKQRAAQNQKKPNFASRVGIAVTTSSTFWVKSELVARIHCAPAARAQRIKGESELHMVSASKVGIAVTEHERPGGVSKLLRKVRARNLIRLEVTLQLLAKEAQTLERLEERLYHHPLRWKRQQV
jgi:hypothetical protein